MNCIKNIEFVKIKHFNDLNYVADLKAITHLNISNNQLIDISPLKKLINLTHLRIYSNALTDISPLRNLKNIIWLDLNSNMLTDIAPLLELRELTRLYLNTNNLTNISPLSELTKLTELELTCFNLSNLSPLKALKNIVSLHLISHILMDISPLLELKKITELKFGCYQLKDIAPLSELSNLRKLKLNCFNIDGISIFLLKKLKRLTELNLSNNHIKDVSFIEKLKKITKLDLSNNQIEDISFIKEVKKITTLNLSNNYIKDVSFIKELKNIKELNLSNNQIRDISFIKELKKLITIDFNYNPIISPPAEIAAKGLKTILDYYKSKRVLNNEIKLILIGNTSVGKSSLRDFMIDREYKNCSSTHGIEVKKWEPKNKDLNVNVWDFGGQEYYHATHRLFLTSNAIYLLLWEKIKNKSATIPTEIFIEGCENKQTIDLQHHDYFYWLNTIGKYAKLEKDCESNPVIMLQTKVDNPENKHCIEDIPERQIIEKYGINNFYPISVLKASEYLKNNNSENKIYWNKYEEFEIELIETLVKTDKNRKIQEYIVNIRTKIREKELENIWDWEQYKTFCFENAGKKISKLQFKILTEYLHDTGVIIYYGYSNIPDESTILNHVVFINPNFVTKTIYKILNLEVQRNKGTLTIIQIKNILKDNKLVNLFIALMKSPNFELIFEHPEKTDTYIAPQYLPDKFTEDKNTFKTITANLSPVLWLFFPYHFTNNYMNRFMAKYGKKALSNIFWKHGIIITSKNEERAYVKCEFDQKSIIIHAEKEKLNNGLVKDIFKTFINICNDSSMHISTDGEFFVPWAKAEKNLELKISRFVYNNQVFDMEIRKWLLNYEEIKESIDITNSDDGKTKPEIHKIYDLLKKIDKRTECTLNEVKGLKTQVVEIHKYLEIDIELLENFYERCEREIPEPKLKEIENLIYELNDNLKEGAEEIVNVLFDRIDERSGKLDDALKTLYNAVNNTDDISTKIKLFIPILNLIGLDISTEADLNKILKKWGKKKKTTK